MFCVSIFLDWVFSMLYTATQSNGSNTEIWIEIYRELFNGMSVGLVMCACFAISAPHDKLDFGKFYCSLCPSPESLCASCLNITHSPTSYPQLNVMRNWCCSKHWFEKLLYIFVTRHMISQQIAGGRKKNQFDFFMKINFIERNVILTFIYKIQNLVA